MVLLGLINPFEFDITRCDSFEIQAGFLASFDKLFKQVKVLVT